MQCHNILCVLCAKQSLTQISQGEGVLGPPEIDPAEITKEQVLGDGVYYYYTLVHFFLRIITLMRYFIRFIWCSI